MLFGESMESMTCTGSAATLDSLARKLSAEPLSELGAVLKTSSRGEARACAVTSRVIFQQQQSYRDLMLEVLPVG